MSSPSAASRYRASSAVPFEAQVLTYLRISGLKLGLLINFGEPRVIDGIRRVVNGL